MRIRHLVAASNVDADGYIINPLEVRHGIVVGGRVADLAGLIEAITHLNLDAPEHSLDDCLVAERLEPGAVLRRAGDYFQVTRPRLDAYTHLGRVDVDERQRAWKQALNQGSGVRGQGPGGKK